MNSLGHQPMGEVWLIPHKINKHLHVPKPGMVQYYRPEATPFVNNEIFAAIHVPIEVAGSTQRKRYLDRIRELIKQYTLEQNIKIDFFTGKELNPLDKKLEEMEILNSASDSIKKLSDSGAINSIIETVNNLHVESQQMYYGLVANFESVINASN